MRLGARAFEQALAVQERPVEPLASQAHAAKPTAYSIVIRRESLNAPEPSSPPDGSSVIAITT